MQARRHVEGYALADPVTRATACVCLTGSQGLLQPTKLNTVPS